VGVWPRGVDRTLFNPDARDETWRREVLGAGPEEAVVLFVARLRWEKGLEALASVLEAVQAKGVPHVSVVVGDGPAREELQRRLPASLFLGKASRRNLNPPRPLTRRPHPCVEPPCCRRHRVPPAPPLASRLSRAAAPLPRSAPDGS
jgi:glycosyltransferase involved in cell wall biosynthesis